MKRVTKNSMNSVILLIMGLTSRCLGGTCTMALILARLFLSVTRSSTSLVGVFNKS